MLFLDLQNQMLFWIVTNDMRKIGPFTKFNHIEIKFNVFGSITLVIQGSSLFFHISYFRLKNNKINYLIRAIRSSSTVPSWTTGKLPFQTLTHSISFLITSHCFSIDCPPLVYTYIILECVFSAQMTASGPMKVACALKETWRILCACAIILPTSPFSCKWCL